MEYYVLSALISLTITMFLLALIYIDPNYGKTNKKASLQKTNLKNKGKSKTSSKLKKNSKAKNKTVSKKRGKSTLMGDDGFDSL